MKKIVLWMLLLVGFGQVFAQQETYTAVIRLNPKWVTLFPYENVQLHGTQFYYIHLPQMGAAVRYNVPKSLPWAEDVRRPFIPYLTNCFVPLPEGYQSVGTSDEWRIEYEEAPVGEAMKQSVLIPYSDLDGSVPISDRRSGFEKCMDAVSRLVDAGETRVDYPRSVYEPVLDTIQGNKRRRYSALWISMFAPFRYEVGKSLSMWTTVRITLPIEKRTDMPVYTVADREQDAADLAYMKAYSIDFGEGFDSMYGPLDDYITGVRTPSGEADDALRVRFNNRGLPLAFCTLPNGSEGRLTVCDMAGRLLESHDLTATYNSIEVGAATGGVVVLTLYVDGCQVASQKCSAYVKP